MGGVIANSGTGVDYEDDGETLKTNASVTSLRFAHIVIGGVARRLEVNISKPEGNFVGSSARRKHVLQLRGFNSTEVIQEVSCCISNTVCSTLHEIQPGDFDAVGYWQQTVEAAEMAVTCGAVLVACPYVRRSESLQVRVNS